MSTSYTGEIKIWGAPFVPQGWAACDGSQLSIHQFQPLFSLLGTTFGGDGRSNFHLPDLRGRTPVNPGDRIGGQGTAGGSESVALDITQIPGHTHRLLATQDDAHANEPHGRIFAKTRGSHVAYAPAQSEVPMAQEAVADIGNGDPHQNMQPSLALTFTIALDGIYPPHP